jgi:hypothetical protein
MTNRCQKTATAAAMKASVMSHGVIASQLWRRLAPLEAPVGGLSQGQLDIQTA